MLLQMALFHCVCVFFLMPESYSIVHVDTPPVSIHVTGYFGGVLVLTVVNRIVVKVGVLVSF